MTAQTRPDYRRAALAAAGVAAVLVLASCSSDSDAGSGEEDTPPAETAAAEPGPLDDLPDGVDIDDLDTELVGIYDDGEQMPVDEACELATELDLDTAQLLAVGVLLEDPSLGQQFLNLADARRRQGYGDTAEERLAGFDDETDAGAAIDETC